MVADPLRAGAALLAGEDVEADFGPVVDALGNFDGLVLGMIGGIDAIDEAFLADGGVVGMELDHRVAGRTVSRRRRPESRSCLARGRIRLRRRGK